MVLTLGSSSDVTENLRHYLRFGVGVVLYVSPGLLGKAPFLGSVEVPVLLVAAKPIPKVQHPLGFLTALGKYMEIDLRGCAFEHPVLIPVRLPDAEHIPSSFQSGDIAGFLGGILHQQQNIQDGFGT